MPFAPESRPPSHFRKPARTGKFPLGSRLSSCPLALRRGIVPLLALSAASLLAACGGGGGENVIQKKVGEDVRPVAIPVLATKNTTRVPGKDAIEDAAGVSRAVWPALGDALRPQAVAIASEDDWRGGIAASVLLSAPVRAPILLSDGADLPGATADTLKSLRPRGSVYTSGAQVIAIGAAPKPEGFRTIRVGGKDPYALAEQIDSLLARARGKVSNSVVVASGEEPEFAMPAAGWAAKSGDPVLFTARDVVPPATRRAIARHRHPDIYVLGPASVVSDQVVRDLRKLGSVTRVGGRDPVANAIAFARFSNGRFGWGAQDPGHGIVIVNVDRPADAAASGALSSSGTYGPLLLTDSAKALPPALNSYLLDIQPGYRDDPVRGVYNHAWLIGDESAISAVAQAKIDELTEIVRVSQRPSP